MEAVYHKLGDQELYSLLKSDDHAAFTALYNRYKGMLYLHAYRMLQDEEEAKDVIQEVFSLIWSKRAVLDITTEFESYLFVTVKNRILNFIAHQKVIEKYSKYLNDFVDYGVQGYDEQLMHKDLLAMIQAEVQQLPEKMKVIFELSRYEGLSYKQIAEKLNISDKTVKKQLNNASKILKPKIAPTIIFYFLL